VTDHLTDELVTEHDVTVGVVEGAAGGVVDGEIGMIHEVDVGGADRRAERA
jgi:hypothetical protein